jgi:hypothetical protein
VPDWTKLLQWYSRFKPGKTVYEWINEHDVGDAVDVRRFILFGVIKVISLSTLACFPADNNGLC